MDVVVITGPGGAGKSTLAHGLAARLGWACLSEDEYWIANGWGAGLRSLEQEEIVQEQVARDLVAARADGGGAVLELILYKVPPNPLTAYQEVLTAHGIVFETIVLRPTVAEILRRVAERGRPSDADVARRRLDAVRQLAVLRSDHIDPAWVIDPTGLTIDETLTRALARLDL